MIRIASALALIIIALFGFDRWAAWLMETNPAARAFVLSDRFLPALLGGIALSLAGMLGIILVLAFIPSRSGRRVPERGE